MADLELVHLAGNQGRKLVVNRVLRNERVAGRGAVMELELLEGEGWRTRQRLVA